MRSLSITVALLVVLTILSTATNGKKDEEKEEKPLPCVSGETMSDSLKKVIADCKDEAEGKTLGTTDNPTEDTTSDSTGTPSINVVEDTTGDSTDAPTTEVLDDTTGDSTDVPSTDVVDVTTEGSRRKRNEGSEVKPVTDDTRPSNDEELTIPPNAENEGTTEASPKANRKRRSDKKDKTIVGNDGPNTNNDGTVPPENADESKPETGKRKRRDDDSKSDEDSSEEDKKKDKKKKNSKKEKEEKDDKFRMCMWNKLNMIDEATLEVKEEGVKSVINELNIDEKKKTALNEATEKCVNKSGSSEESKEKAKNFWKVMKCIQKSVKNTCPDAKKWEFGREKKQKKSR